MPAEESVQRAMVLDACAARNLLLAARARGVDDPNVGQVHDGKACAPHRPTPVGLLEEEEVILGKQPDPLDHVPAPAEQCAEDGLDLARPGDPAPLRRKAGGQQPSNRPRGTSSVSSRGSLWIEFCGRPSVPAQRHADGSHPQVRVEVVEASQHAPRSGHVAVELNSRDSSVRATQRGVVAAREAEIPGQCDHAAPRKGLPRGVRHAVVAAVVDQPDLAIDRDTLRCRPQSTVSRVPDESVGCRGFRRGSSGAAPPVHGCRRNALRLRRIAQEFTGDEPLSRQARQQNRASSRECSSRERRSRVGSRARLAAKRGGAASITRSGASRSD